MNKLKKKSLNLEFTPFLFLKDIIFDLVTQFFPGINSLLDRKLLLFFFFVLKVIVESSFTQ